MAGLKLDIVSPERQILSAQVAEVTVPGQEGYFTIMGDHAPLMTVLKTGFVSVKSAEGDKIYYVAGGFADVSIDGLTILAAYAKTGADFDRTQIEKSIDQARQALNQADDLAAKSIAQIDLDGWQNLLLDAASQTGLSN